MPLGAVRSACSCPYFSRSRSPGAASGAAEWRLARHNRAAACRPSTPDRWLDWNKVAPLVVEYQALIDAEVRLDGRKLYGYDRFNPATLQAFFERRRAFLLNDSGTSEHD